MTLSMFQIDAFAKKPFEGNPAAIVPLKNWISDKIMQKIAMENNLSETAFFVQENNEYYIRWFTPTEEVDMCGHATLASAYVIFNELNFSKDEIVFNSKSGKLFIKKEDEKLSMDFPALKIEKHANKELFSKAIGIEVIEVYKAMAYIVIVDSEEELVNLEPDFVLLTQLDLRGVIVTSKSKKYDFVCRFFAPKFGINEDPVTGSAYTQLVYYWSKVLNKNDFHTKQLSLRGGIVDCELQENRCIIKGSAVKYFEGQISI